MSKHSPQKPILIQASSRTAGRYIGNCLEEYFNAAVHYQPERLAEHMRAEKPELVILQEQFDWAQRYTAHMQALKSLGYQGPIIFTTNAMMDCVRASLPDDIFSKEDMHFLDLGAFQFNKNRPDTRKFIKDLIEPGL